MLKLVDLTKRYRTSEVETLALSRVSLDIRQGEFLAIMGPSGCGKSTLLNILGLLDSPSDGQFFFLGEEISRASERQLTLLRRANVGFVFQSFNLIDELTVAENVEVALIYRGVGSAERKRRDRGGAGAGRAAASRPPSAAAAFRRPAAARRGSARAGRGAQADPGRRADRQSRYRQWRCRHGHADRDRQGRHHRHHGHAQPSARRLCRTHAWSCSMVRSCPRGP